MKLTAKQRRKLERQAEEQRRELGLPCVSFKKIYAAMTEEQRADLMRKLFPARHDQRKEGEHDCNIRN